jgi:arginase
MGRRWSLLSVPIDSVGRPGGTELGPEALLAAGLADAVEIGERDATLTVLRDPGRDPGSGVVSHPAVLELTRELRAKSAELNRAGDPLLVVGGCCTLVPGVLGGLRDDGVDPGLAYVDGHLDLYDGASSPTGEAADMPLAVALGRGPDEWHEAAGGATLVADRLALLGFRDLEEARGLGSLLPADLPGGSFVDTPGLRDAGLRRSGEAAAAALADVSPDGYWVHLDLDVLDESAFPATDAFVPGGLDWDELTDLVTPLIAAEACLGVDVACFNPEKDADGSSARHIVELLGATLG